jgi:hypothetical protein
MGRDVIVKKVFEMGYAKLCGRYARFFESEDSLYPNEMTNCKREFIKRSLYEVSYDDLRLMNDLRLMRMFDRYMDDHIFIKWSLK